MAAVALHILFPPIAGGIDAAVIATYAGIMGAGGAAGLFINNCFELLQESQKPTILLIGMSGVGKSTLIKNLQDATEEEKVVIPKTLEYENHTIYLANQPYNIWDYSGADSNQIQSIINILESNSKFFALYKIKIIPLFVVDIFPSEDDLPFAGISKMPSKGSLSIRDDVVKQRLVQQRNQLSDYYCKSILGRLDDFTRIKAAGYLVNKIDLLDKDSQERVFEVELPLLKFLEEISTAWNFRLEKEAVSALYGFNSRDFLAKLVKN
jgi:GTPase SAR1 family protein